MEVWRLGQQWGEGGGTVGERFLDAPALTAWAMCRGGDWDEGVKWEGGWCGGGVNLQEPPFTPWVCLQSNFCESHTWRLVSWKALRALNALGATCLSRFWGRKANGSDEKTVKQKVALKKTDRTNIIAANFVWEQLKRNKARLASLWPQFDGGLDTSSTTYWNWAWFFTTWQVFNGHATLL